MTSSDQTRKWIKITLSHLQPDFKKKKNFFNLHKPNPSRSSSNQYQLILACKERPLSSYFKFNRGKIYSYKNTSNYPSKRKVKLATIVDGHLKVPFSIATTPNCRGGRDSFPWIAPLYPWIRTLWCWVLSKEASSTIFWVFGMTQPGIEPRSPGALVNALTTMSMSGITIPSII